MKIKHPLLLAALLLLTGSCLAQKSFLERYSKMDGVTTVYISKTMLQIMPQMEIYADIDLQEFSGRLTGILILTSEKESITKQMRSEATEFYSGKAFEVLMKIKDDESLVSFYIRRKNEQRIAELVMLVDDEDEFVIIQMIGDLTMEDIKKMTKDVQFDH